MVIIPRPLSESILQSRVLNGDRRRKKRLPPVLAPSAAVRFKTSVGIAIDQLTVAHKKCSRSPTDPARNNTCAGIRSSLAIDHAQWRDDPGLVGGDAVEVAHLFMLDPRTCTSISFTSIRRGFLSRGPRC